MSEPPALELELPEPKAPGVPFLLLEAAGHWFGVALPDLLEVVTAREYTLLPGAPPAVLGLLNLRGRIVTVVDLSALLELSTEPGSAGRIVVVEHRGKRIGLAADDAPRIVKIEPDIIEPPGRDQPNTISSVVEVEGRALAILDTAALLGPLLV